jgi:beta-mannosidase
VNDTLGVLRGSVRLSVYDFFGALLGERAWEAEVPANAAVKIGELAEREALMGGRPERVYVRLTAGGFDAPANGYFLRDHKNLALPKVAVRAEATGAPGEVVVTAEGGLARMVKLELPAGNLRFSDNYFDLLPGEARTVRISRADGAPADLSGLTVSAVNS